MLRSQFAQIRLFRQARKFRELLRSHSPFVTRGTDYPDVSKMMERGLPYYFLYELRPSEPMNCMLYQVTAFDQDGVLLFHYCNNHLNSLWYWRRQGIARTADAIERSVRHAFSMYGVYLDKSKPFDKVDEHVFQINPDWHRINYFNRLTSKS